MTDADFRQFVINIGTLSAGIVIQLAGKNLKNAERLAREINDACCAIYDYYDAKAELEQTVAKYVKKEGVNQ